MYKILVPVDGSDSAARALEAALEMAHRFQDAELHVVTVQSPIISGNVSRFFSPEVLDAYYQDEGQNALLSISPQLEASNVPYTKEVIVGDIAEEINHYVSKHGCQHIVMGTRGLSAMPSLIMGSVTSKVIHQAKVPVTLIK